MKASTSPLPPLFFGGDLFDFGEDFNSNTLASDVFADYVAADSTSSQNQPIGGNGLQGGFGVVFNGSFVVAVAIDTSHGNTLNVFSGSVGGTLTGGPIKSIKAVTEARIFPVGSNRFVITLVQNEPGLFSMIRGQLK